MTIPANPNLEAAPYGAQPVVVVVGAQGGPYAVLDATHGMPVEVIAGAGTGAQVQGTVAAGVADAGNPVKIGGFGSAAAPTAVAAGQRVNAWYDLSGRAVVLLCDPASANTARVSTPGDNAGALTGVGTVSQQAIFNGTTFDRRRSNVEVTLLASAARTATIQSADQTNYNGKRLLLVVDVSLVGTGSITPSLQVKDPISGNYFTFWTAAAAVVTGATFAYLFEGGASGGSFTEKLAFGLPARTWRLVMTHNNANTITYSASANVGV